MDKELIKSSIENRREEIEVARSKIKKLQKECNHESYHIQQYFFAGGIRTRARFSRICDWCDDYLGEASKSEIEEYVRKNPKPKQFYGDL